MDFDMTLTERGKNNIWWDEEYKEKKAEVQRRLKESQKGRGERRSIKWLQTRKKKENEEKLLKEIEKDKSQETFWKATNSRRKKREDINEDLKGEDCMAHFGKVYCGQGKEKYPTIGLQPDSLDESLIDKRELQATIRNMKKGSAGGRGEIPNNAKIYGEKELLED